MVAAILSFQSPSQSIGVRAFDPVIATALKSDRLAVIVQQIHFMAECGLGEVVNGTRWIFNSYRAWQKEMPWLSVWQLRQAFQELRSLGVLRFEKRKKSRCNHTGWYSLDYTELQKKASEVNLVLPHIDVRASHTSACDEPQIDVMTDHTSDLRILTPKTQSKENNSTDAAAFLSSDLDPEEEAPTSLASNPSQHITHETVTEVLDPKDKDSAPARDNRSIEMLLVYGFELTRQLERIALKYDREEIQKSLTHLTNCKKTQAIKNDAGWLTSCLRDKWYLSDFSLVQAQSSDGVENETKKEPPKPTWRLMTPEEEEARRLAEEEKNRKAREAMEQWKEQNKGLIREIRAQVALGATAKRNPAVAPPRPPVIEETLEENMARIAKEKVRLLAEFRKMRLEESEQGDDLEF